MSYTMSSPIRFYLDRYGRPIACEILHLPLGAPVIRCSGTEEPADCLHHLRRAALKETPFHLLHDGERRRRRETAERVRLRWPEAAATHAALKLVRFGRFGFFLAAHLVSSMVMSVLFLFPNAKQPSRLSRTIDGVSTKIRCSPIGSASIKATISALRLFSRRRSIDDVAITSTSVRLDMRRIRDG